jgi:hypothetical protein
MSKNPKKVVNAFFPPVVKIATLDGKDIALREFSIGTMLFLQRLEHPLVTGDLAAGGQIKMSQEETLALLFVLTRPLAECKALLDDGEDAFDTAVLTFAETLPVTKLGQIRAAVLGNFARAWETALATMPEGQKKTG